MAEKFAKFMYVTGPYSFRFSCKANGYKIHFYRHRVYLVKDGESIKQLREDPFFQEVGVDASVEKVADDATGQDSKSEPAKKLTKKRAPKLSKAVESKRA